MHIFAYTYVNAVSVSGKKEEEICAQCSHVSIIVYVYVYEKIKISTELKYLLRHVYTIINSLELEHQ